ARGRAEPARRLRQFHRRRSAAASGARGDPRRPARQAVRSLRQANREARMRPLTRVAGPLAAFVALGIAIAVTPAFLSGFREQQAAYVGIYTIALLGLNVLTGYTGQISLGHGAFI